MIIRTKLETSEGTSFLNNEHSVIRKLMAEYASGKAPVAATQKFCSPCRVLEFVNGELRPCRAEDPMPATKKMINSMMTTFVSVDGVGSIHVSERKLDHKRMLADFAFIHSGDARVLDFTVVQFTDKDGNEYLILVNGSHRLVDLYLMYKYGVPMPKNTMVRVEYVSIDNDLYALAKLHNSFDAKISARPLEYCLRNLMAAYNSKRSTALGTTNVKMVMTALKGVLFSDNGHNNKITLSSPEQLEDYLAKPAVRAFIRDIAKANDAADKPKTRLWGRQGTMSAAWDKWNIQSGSRLWFIKFFSQLFGKTKVPQIKVLIAKQKAYPAGGGTGFSMGVARTIDDFNWINQTWKAWKAGKDIGEDDLEVDGTVRVGRKGPRGGGGVAVEVSASVQT